MTSRSTNEANERTVTNMVETLMHRKRRKHKGACRKWALEFDSFESVSRTF